MTKEEAVKRIKTLRLKIGEPTGISLGWLESWIHKEDVEAFDMAIKALEQQSDTWSLGDAREDFMHDVYNTLDFLPTNNEANHIIDSFDRVTSNIEQQSDDCVSRQAVKDIIHEYKNNIDSQLSWLSDGVCNLPPVTPTFPSNATNGDMIKAIFPNMEIECLDKHLIYTNGLYKSILREKPYNDHEDNVVLIARSLGDWWNAPYTEKRGSEEEA